MSISTHVLDTARGRPAAGLTIRLERQAGDGWQTVGEGVTDDDGRVKGLLGGGALEKGVWRMTFETGAWFDAEGIDGFYPVARVVFRVTAPDQHHHVPLLLSPFGYSTYRGS